MITITKKQELIDDVARRTLLAKLVKRHVKKWAKENNLLAKIDDVLLRGKALIINKKTGKIDTLPEARELLKALQSKLSNDKEIH